MITKKKYSGRLIVVGTIFLSLLPSLQIINAELPSSLLINEVMYYPAEDENYNEWIELYNPTSSPIDVDGWTLSDGQETDTLQGDTIHGDGTISIPPNGYAIITDKGTHVYETFMVDNIAIRLSVDDSTLCGYGLKNSGEIVILCNTDGTVVDAMEWGVDSDTVPGTPAPLVSKGHSLARYPETDTDDSLVDFYESSTPTPGSENIAEPQQVEQANENPAQGETTAHAPLLLITELYYRTHSTWNNEFVAVSNPTISPMDLSGWYLTDEPWKETSEQAKIFFPDHAILPSNTSWYITQNASAFDQETGRLPEFEYKVDSRSDVPQMNTDKTMTLSNTGGVVALIDDDLNTIDLVVYGDTDYCPAGWDGLPIPSSGAGTILKRTIIDGVPIDTNTASDWSHPRIYHIGQSDFPAKTISYTGEVTMFVSPDSSFETIVGELRNVRSSIDMNMYEFTDPALYTELLSALKRNVSVRLFIEGSPIGGIDDREKYILKSLASNGGVVRFIVSDTTNHVNARYQFDHAKYLILDNETVIVESCNWVKTGIPEDPTFGNREWGIVIRDKRTAAQFLQVFLDDWNPERIDSYSIDAMNLAIPPDFSLVDMIPTGPYTPQFPAKTISGYFTVTPIFSPDSSEQAILNAIETATTSIYVQQLYIYKDWDTTVSPFVEQLIAKAEQGIIVKVILNYNPEFTESLVILNETKQYLEEYNISVKFLSTTWAPFAAIHNKGMIIDNTTVLISSINWNEQSVRKNREAGVLLENTDVATYYADVFFSDWVLSEPAASPAGFSWADYKYFVLIAVVFSITILLILRDWRKRKW